MEDWDALLVRASDLVLKKENYQKRLGQLAADVVALRGPSALPSFASEMQDSTGYRISPTTLRNYAWVWKRTKELNIPEDIPFTTCQLIAGTSDPQFYANKIIVDGMSSPEVVRLIKGDRPDRLVTCPLCGGTFNEKTQKEENKKA